MLEPPRGQCFDEVMQWEFNGLPIHILVIHFVVIAVPVAALCIVLAAAWPAARRRLGLVTPILALLALVSVPIAEKAGEALEEQVKETALVEIHTALGDTLLPWSAAVFFVAAIQWVWFRYFEGRDGKFAGMVRTRALRLAITIVLAAAVAVVAVGSSATVFIIGESGANATWSSRTSGAAN